MREMALSILFACAVLGGLMWLINDLDDITSRKKAHYCEVSAKYLRTSKDSLHYELVCP